MTTEQQINQALKRIMSEGEANACRIFKGFDWGTGQTGWHYIPFGQTAVFLGGNAAEAMETIEDIASEKTEVR